MTFVAIIPFPFGRTKFCVPVGVAVAVVIGVAIGFAVGIRGAVVSTVAGATRLVAVVALVCTVLAAVPWRL